MPVSYKIACDFVNDYHRHHKAPQGHKFSIGLAKDGLLVGVCIVGRPVSRYLDNGQTLEVTRLCTDGTPNACSMLYRSAWKAAKAMGYVRMITYILNTESGSSLRGAGFTLIGERGSTKGWSVPSRPRGETPNPQMKLLFEISI